ncbi:MAG: hypothetical protein HN919_12870 [Verrucomicrobia bacterium]|jgi:hypothetical protein|nr:hypothetical protein [Verrucomicrobiota bacterium]MBT7067192.1 hypothetical protein [Verrucomicrobiota bacterium]MBT7699076.1 hypothetical protein [Verrucomicrobiota bacterium]
MNKTMVTLIAAALLLAIATPHTSTAQAGGAEGFFTGCCFGLRVGADYNDMGTGDREFMPWFLVGACLGPRAQLDYREGKDFHWREIGRAVPYVGGVFMIWDGIDIAGGKGRADLQTAYGENYY